MIFLVGIGFLAVFIAFGLMTLIDLDKPRLGFALIGFGIFMFLVCSLSMFYSPEVFEPEVQEVGTITGIENNGVYLEFTVTTEGNIEHVIDQPITSEFELGDRVTIIVTRQTSESFWFDQVNHPDRAEFVGS